MERKNHSSVPKHLFFLSLVGLVPLALVAFLSTTPISRSLAISLIAGLVLWVTLVNVRLLQQTAQLRHYIDDQEQLIVQRQRYLIAAEIHDGVTQMLFATTLITRAMLAKANACSSEINGSLNDLNQLTSTAHMAVRHILLGLRPTHISEIPLDQLITELVQIKRMSIETDIRCMVVGTASYSPDIHQSLYRIVNLALSNSVLHAQASYILVRLFLSQDEAIITIEDDGCGFNHMESKPGHFGLDDIETCARDIGAVLDWHTLPGPDPKKITCIWRRPTWS